MTLLPVKPKTTLVCQLKPFMIRPWLGLQSNHIPGDIVPSLCSCLVHVASSASFSDSPVRWVLIPSTCPWPLGCCFFSHWYWSQLPNTYQWLKWIISLNLYNNLQMRKLAHRMKSLPKLTKFVSHGARAQAYSNIKIYALSTLHWFPVASCPFVPICLSIIHSLQLIF